MINKNYFDLTNQVNDISVLCIKKKDNFECSLVNNEGVVYDGFKLAESKQGEAFTVCDIIFQKSATDRKYQPRLTFRRIDSFLQDKKLRSNANQVIINFKIGQDGYREFWKMIAFLYRFKDFVDLGEFDDSYAVIEKSLLEFLPKFASLKNKNIILEGLGKLSKNDLENIDNLVNVTKIKNVICEWEKNKENDQEIQFWQPFLKKYFWIIPQIFSSPVNIFDNEFYLGGMSQGNRKGAKFVDFVVKDIISNNISIIEIKTPKKLLVSKNEYDKRTGIYPMGGELIGAISQVLNQKDQIQKDFKFDNQGKDYTVFDPKCILIIGNKEIEKMNLYQEACFELFRKNQKNIEIVTFDEFFGRIKAILEIFGI